MVASRRQFLGSAAVVSGAAVSGMVLQPGAAQAVGPSGGASLPNVVVRPDDPRYPELLTRGFNARFVFSPDSIVLAYSAGQVQEAVQRAVKEGRKFTVRSGGHCLEALVADPRFDMLIDVSPMHQVSWDTKMNAFSVGAGSTLAQAYKALYLGWGVTVPGGVCPPVGIGGHTAGGGYGPLSRKYGLISDHLYAVEVVTVDAKGKARIVVATRRPNDPNRDLWWAHTGGGGGNFGVVTRYWFRDPRATGNNPTKALPQPPARLLMTWVTWPWESLSQADFKRLVQNHGAWHAANSGPDSPYVAMHSALHLNMKRDYALYLECRMDATAPNARRMVEDYIAAISEGVSVQGIVEMNEELWLANALFEYPRSLGARTKSAGSNLRKPLADNQIDIIYRALTDPDAKNSCLVYLGAYGGQVNAVPSDATAVPQRDSILRFWIDSTWADPNADAEAVEWTRRLYRDVHAATGGVPVPNDQYDGCYINYPSKDTKDPAWNTSGVPWHDLYYKGSYPKLQRIKKKYDPLTIFQHAMSIEPA
ncbi:FAD-binding protein [Micromonospora profundi]|uniref:FAD-binding protein n=1 Tax=Micromonospora profundi TaxID=1420889 RepID=A0AAJ6HS94_9ACTN|nr:FAD-binding protein [Micromonospora profundi]WLS43369.1 FAD-binding protein [Micromonospora profundi]